MSTRTAMKPGLSGVAYGHSHGNSNLPLVLAGGPDLGLKHGSPLAFNRGGASRATNWTNPASTIRSVAAANADGA